MIHNIKTIVVVKTSSFFSSVFLIMWNSQSEIFQPSSKKLDTNGWNGISTNQWRSLNGLKNDDLIFQIIQQRINQFEQKKQKAFLNKHLIDLKIEKICGFISSFISNVFIGFFDLRRETAELDLLLKRESWHIVPIISKYKKKFYEELHFFWKFCEQFFKIRSLTYASKQNKVNLDQIYLNKKSLAFWYWLKQRSETWKVFKDFFTINQMFAAQRRLNVYAKFKSARQWKKQNVFEFIIYFKSLKKNIDEHFESSKIEFLLNGFNFQISAFIKIKKIPPTFNDLCESVVKSEKLMNKNDAIKFEWFQKWNHRNQQKIGLSKESQRSRSSFSGRGRGRDRGRDRGRNRSSFYHKGNHQNPATDPNSNAIRGGRINKSAKNNSHVECFRCHKKSHYASICPQSQKSENEER